MRIRNFTPAVAGLLIAAVTTGCGGTASSSSGDEKDAVYSEIAALPKEQQHAKAKELAEQEGKTLSVYTSMTPDISTPVAKAFEKKYGINVSVFRANSETVLQRTMQEVQANRPGADAVETNFVEMNALAEKGYLKDYKGPALGKVEATGKFPHWTASRFNVFQPAWNTSHIKAGDEPQSWEDLALPKYKGKLTLEISDSDWFANVTKYWLEHGKSQKQVDKLWEGIVDNAKVAKGHTTMMEFLSAGQTPMLAMNYTYITDTAVKKGAPVAHLPRNGTSKIPAFGRPNGIGMIKGAQHPASAWLFYHWLLTDGQKTLVDLGLTPSTKVAGDKSLDGLKLAPFAVKELSDKKNAWDKKYDALLRGAPKVGK